MTVHPESELLGSDWIIRQLQRDVEELRSKMRTSSDGAEELFSSLTEARTLIAAGLLGVGGAGFITALILRVILKAEQIRFMDPGIGAGLAVQRGLESLGRWAPVTGFGLGIVIILWRVAHHLWAKSEEGSPRKGSEWQAWAAGLILLVVPFYDFDLGGGSLGLPVGIAIACGIYGFVPVLQRSPATQRIFEYFESPWFGLALVVSALGFFATGYLAPSAPAVMGGVLLASCFSLKLLFLGIQTRAKVRELEQQAHQLEILRAELRARLRDERLDAELEAFIAEREREEETSL